MPEPPSNHVYPEDRAAWRAWLMQHHTRAEGVWLVYHRKAAGASSVTYDEAVEEALCFGWVDSKPGKLDEQRTMLYFAPRKAGSGWAQRNKGRVARLIETGQMTPAGLAKIEAAKADGSWMKLDAAESLAVPDDLAAALAATPAAAEHFAAFPKSARRAILEWITLARKPETRAARVAETARLAAENVRVNQWRPS